METNPEISLQRVCMLSHNARSTELYIHRNEQCGPLEGPPANSLSPSPISFPLIVLPSLHN